MNCSWNMHVLISGVTVGCEKKTKWSVANICSLISQDSSAKIFGRCLLKKWRVQLQAIL